MDTYKVVFDWAGIGAIYDFKWMYEELLSTLFVETYNQFADSTNEHLDDWNKEADSKGYEENDDSDSEYRRFLKEKYEETLKEEMNKGFLKLATTDPSYEWYIDSDCQFHMRLNGGKDLGYIDVSIHVEPM